uniref:Uncharacterized protein DKFZp459E0915 n=1 Tax=Pongo abelii TaxID=9601 RepID=Q5R506_PONAB|nr:hypothetical protein [Pongo abelii]
MEVDVPGVDGRDGLRERRGLSEGGRQNLDVRPQSGANGLPKHSYWLDLWLFIFFDVVVFLFVYFLPMCFKPIFYYCFIKCACTQNIYLYNICNLLKYFSKVSIFTHSTNIMNCLKYFGDIPPAFKQGIRSGKLSVYLPTFQNHS